MYNIPVHSPIVLKLVTDIYLKLLHMVGLLVGGVCENLTF